MTLVDVFLDEAAGWGHIEDLPRLWDRVPSDAQSGAPFTTVVPSRSTAVESVPWT